MVLIEEQKQGDIENEDPLHILSFHFETTEMYTMFFFPFITNFSN